MKTFRLVLVFSLLLCAPAPVHAAWDWRAVQARATEQVQAWTQAASPHVAKFTEQARAQAAYLARVTRLDRYKGYVPSCRQMLIVAGASAAVAVGSIGYYNIPYSAGRWQNLGSETEPVWVPEVGPVLVVEARSPTFSIPRTPSLWVHDAHKGYGKVFFRNDRIEYRNGDQLVAFTDPVSPYGRPYSAEFPIKVRIYDSQANEIGSLEEINSEVRTGVVAVRFRLRDKDGRLLAQTGEFEETETAEPLTQPWAFQLSDGDGQAGTTLTRKGVLWNRYVTDSGDRIREADVRLFVILSAYKHHVDENRD